jgi:hypothetical protein
MVVQMKLKNPRKHWGRRPLLYGKPNMTVGVFPLFQVDPSPNPGQTRIKPSIEENSSEMFGLSSVKNPIQISVKIPV